MELERGFRGGKLLSTRGLPLVSGKYKDTLLEKAEQRREQKGERRQWPVGKRNVVAPPGPIVWADVQQRLLRKVTLRKQQRGLAVGGG